MTDPADPHVCWPDRAWHGAVTVTENVRMARDTYRVRFESPALAARVRPGQFLMLRLAGLDDPLLGRPLALYDTVRDADGKPTGVDVVYLVMGKLTSRLRDYRPGQKLEVWGPLGNGFSLTPAEHLIMVAGGIGQTPFVSLGARYLGKRGYGEAELAGPVGRLAERVTLCYGARTRDYLAGLPDFEALGIDVRVSTDDGTAGHHGLVTAVLEKTLAETAGACRIACCGPEPMLAAVSKIALAKGISCEVSLETPMACGIGICFSCVAKVKADTPEGWDYRRTCIEGPVFEAAELVF